jgi:hypothetical protein
MRVTSLFMLLVGVSSILSACATDKSAMTAGSPYPKPVPTAPTSNMLTTVVVVDDELGFCRPFVPDTEGDDEYYIDIGATYRNPGKIEGFETYPTSYDQQSRTLLERVLVGKQTLATLSGTVSYNNARVSTFQLFSSQHNSDTDKGESFADKQDAWDTGVVVRVSDNDPFRVDLDANFADTIEHMDLITNGIEIAKAAVSTFVPGAHFLSELDKPALEKQSKIYDAALGRTMGKAADSTMTINVLPFDIRKNTCGAVRFTMPGAPSFVGQNLNPKIVVGDWVFGIRRRMQSLFLDPKVKITEVKWTNLSDKVSPLHVLDEIVGGQPAQSLGKFLLANQLVTSDLTDWSKAIATTKTDKTTTDVKNAAAASFCKDATAALHGIGLTALDAKFGLWAVLEKGSLPGKPSLEDIASLKVACKADLLPIDLSSEIPPPASPPPAKPANPAGKTKS